MIYSRDLELLLYSLFSKRINLQFLNKFIYGLLTLSVDEAVKRRALEALRERMEDLGFQDAEEMLARFIYSARSLAEKDILKEITPEDIWRKVEELEEKYKKMIKEAGWITEDDF